ncbi:MAG: FtsH protease activity modulator HflK [Anaplasmataceae bacterium]|nr:FtsH protease activity modulator HflK [Anaplasmataceae bacterium]
MSYNPWDNNNNDVSKNNNNFKDSFKFNNNFNRNFDFFKPSYILGFIILIFLGWLLSGTYVVGANEQGLEIAFGKYHDLTMPGLHYNFPNPFGNVIKVPVSNIKREVIGESSMISNNRMSVRAHDGLMLTGDENIVNVNFELQWKISDPYKYVFNVRDYNSGDTVRNAAESAVRDIIAQQEIIFLMSGEGRAYIANAARKLLQSVLDGYEMGVSILSIQLKKIDPPEAVIKYFRDVQSARADKEREINQAYSYSNSVIPKARGEASKIKYDAEAYSAEKVLIAEGDTLRFMKLYEEYKKDKKLTNNRIYIETMEQIYSKLNKAILGKESAFSHLSVSQLFANNKKD